MSNMPSWYGGNQRDWGPPPDRGPSMSSRLDRMRNPPPPQRSTLPGRIISDPNEIVPGEIPMDGSVSVFLMEDLSRIIVSGWNSTGKLVPVVYTPEPQKPPEPPASVIPDEFKSAIFARLDGIEALLKNNTPKTKALAKKEESTNGSNG